MAAHTLFGVWFKVGMVGMNDYVHGNIKLEMAFLTHANSL